MPRYRRTQQAEAVGLVLAGRSRREAGRALGVSEATVRRWMAQVERRTSTQEKEVARMAEDFAGRIREKEAEAREKLLDRILEFEGPASLRDLAVAYGVLTDKARLATGQPTEIVNVERSFRADIEALSNEELERTMVDFCAPLEPSV